MPVEYERVNIHQVVRGQKIRIERPGYETLTGTVDSIQYADSINRVVFVKTDGGRVVKHNASTPNSITTRPRNVRTVESRYDEAMKFLKSASLGVRKNAIKELLDTFNSTY